MLSCIAPPPLPRPYCVPLILEPRGNQHENFLHSRNSITSKFLSSAHIRTEACGSTSCANMTDAVFTAACTSRYSVYVQMNGRPCALSPPVPNHGDQ